MDDTRPPRGFTDDRELLLGMLGYHRASLLAKGDGLTDEQARWSPVGSGTSILWLIDHLTFVDHVWFEVRFTGTSELHMAIESDSLDTARQRSIESWDDVCRIVRAASLDDFCVGDTGGEPVDLRWVLTHLVGETARHAGHADIVRELIDGSTGR